VDYYQVIGVGPKASQSDIRDAYRRRARTCHPDLQPSFRKAWAEDQMAELNEAYSVLSSRLKRRRYDVQSGHRKRIFTRDTTRPRHFKLFFLNWTFSPTLLRRIRRVSLVSLTAYLLLGAYLIFVPWGPIFVNLETALRFPAQIVFAEVWIFVLAWSGSLVVAGEIP
jgi:hypothetical protein